MTDFVSVLTDIHQQRQFDLPLLREFISTNPPSFVDFFFIKITLCHYSKLKVSFLPVFQGRDIIIIMKCHDFIVKGNYTDNPFKAEAPVCITAAISPTGQNKLLLLSRWFVGTLVFFFKKWGIFILERICNGLKWKYFSWFVAHHPLDLNWRDWGIVLTIWLVIFLRINSAAILKLHRRGYRINSTEGTSF